MDKIERAKSKEIVRKHFMSYVLKDEAKWAFGSVTQVPFLKQQVMGRN